MLRPASAIALLLLSGACALPTEFRSFADSSPPDDFGRPGWVRAAARTGVWIGGMSGIAVSIVVAPVTLPLGELASDGLGAKGKSEFALFPAMACASVGHSLFAFPCDTLDYLGRRMWTDPTPMPDPRSEAVAGLPAPGSQGMAP